MKKNMTLFLIVLLLISFFFFLSNNFVYSRGCGYELLKHHIIHNPQRVKPIGDDSRYLASESYEPIRIHLDFSFIERDLSKFKKKDLEALKDYIMPKTKEVFERIINVKRLKNKLKFNTKTCDELRIPEEYLESGQGVDADLVIFVTIDDTGFFLENEIEAAAIHCLQHSQTGRPIAGYIQFKPDLDMTDTTALDYLVWLAVHETSHILVMNDGLYGDYVDKNNVKLGIQSVLRDTVHPLSGKRISVISTPKVLEKAREHFGCDKLDGVPLEYNGGPGTAGAHWSKKIMNTDYMIGDSYGENLISDITLALFEDSGWYAVDFNMSNLFLWGHKKGCDFFTKKCVGDLNVATRIQSPEYNKRIYYRLEDSDPNRVKAKDKDNSVKSAAKIAPNNAYDHGNNPHHDDDAAADLTSKIRPEDVSVFAAKAKEEHEHEEDSDFNDFNNNIGSHFLRKGQGSKERSLGFHSYSRRMKKLSKNLTKAAKALVISKKSKNTKSSKSKKQIYPIKSNGQGKRNTIERQGKRTFNKHYSAFPEEFCQMGNQQICSRHHIFRGTCTMKTFASPLPEYERYFSNRYLGGIDNLTDKCPITIESKGAQYYYGGSCRKGEKRFDMEEVCPECACFMSTLKKVNDRNSIPKRGNLKEGKNKEQHWEQNKDSRRNSKSKYSQAQEDENDPDINAMCFKFSCESSSKSLNVVVEGVSYQCNSKGIRIRGYSGKLFCPDAKILCHEKFKCKFGCTEMYSNANPYKVLRKKYHSNN